MVRPIKRCFLSAFRFRVNRLELCAAVSCDRCYRTFTIENCLAGKFDVTFATSLALDQKLGRRKLQKKEANLTHGPRMMTRPKRESKEAFHGGRSAHSARVTWTSQRGRTQEQKDLVLKQYSQLVFDTVPGACIAGNGLLKCLTKVARL